MLLFTWFYRHGSRGSHSVWFYISTALVAAVICFVVFEFTILSGIAKSIAQKIWTIITSRHNISRTANRVLTILYKKISLPTTTSKLKPNMYTATGFRSEVIDNLFSVSPMIKHVKFRFFEIMDIGRYYIERMFIIKLSFI